MLHGTILGSANTVQQCLQLSATCTSKLLEGKRHITYLHPHPGVVGEANRGFVSCSNAGAIFFGTVLRNLAMENETLRPFLMGHRTEAVEEQLQDESLGSVAGIIMDSSPARLTPDIAAR